MRDGETMAETRRGDGGGGVRADGAAADVFALFGASDGVRAWRSARALASPVFEDDDERVDVGTSSDARVDAR